MEEIANTTTTWPDAPAEAIEMMAKLLASTMSNKTRHACAVKTIIAGYGHYNYCRACKLLVEKYGEQPTEGKEARHEER